MGPVVDLLPVGTLRGWTAQCRMGEVAMKEGNRTGYLAVAAKSEETRPTRQVPAGRTNLYGSAGGGTSRRRVVDDWAGLWAEPVRENTSVGNRLKTLCGP